MVVDSKSIGAVAGVREDGNVGTKRNDADISQTKATGGLHACTHARMHASFSYPEIVAGGDEEVRGFSKQRLGTGIEHKLCGWVCVNKGERRLRYDGESFWVEREDTDVVCVFFNHKKASCCLTNRQ